MNARDLAVGTEESVGLGRRTRQSGHDAARNLALHTEQPGQNGPVRPFEPVTTRYIKLGKNGKWATDALQEGIIPFGYSAVDHHACLDGEWNQVRHQLSAMGRTANGVSQGLRELKDFYVW